jgi:glucose/arabinose dehydrogenase
MRLVYGFTVCIVLIFAVLSAPVRAQSGPDAAAITLPDGYRAEVVSADLLYPTHITIGPEGVLYLTQLAGGENENKGQVVRLSPTGGAQIVLDRLAKPIGLTFADGKLFISARNSVLVSAPRDPAQPNGLYAEPTVLFADIPFNGRSIGQIMTGPDKNLYFQSTGTEFAPDASGQIFLAKPDGTGREVFARGFKNAYAMTWHPETGAMYATEIYDGLIPGVGVGPEELNRVERGGDYGWPRCYADQKENTAFGGNRSVCAGTNPALATFPPAATPTGLAYFDGWLVVALWGTDRPRLVSVDPETGEVADFATGFRRPIALLTDDAGLLVVDIDGSAVYRVLKTR